jgi:CubicO group peptidase (beta-lactamase class C family)
MTQLRYGSPAEAGMLPDRVERARQLAAGWVKDGYSPAIATLVARHGVIVLHEGFGVLGPEAGASPLPRDALFPVQSVTKSITATLVMCLVEDGLVGLNRPAAEYLPELRGEGKDEILVHHLLTHTWGEDIDGIIATLVKRATEGRGDAPCPEGLDPQIHQVLQACYEAPLARPPGEVMMYGAFGYILLGEIVRRVSGQPFVDFAQQRLFGPLGMTDSWLVVPESVSARVVRRPADAPLAGPNRLGPGLNTRAAELMPNSAGGLYSTIHDLAVYAQTFLNGGRYGDARILSRPAVEAMVRNQIPGLRFEFGTVTGDACMGYGWFVESHVKWRPMGSLHALGTFNHMGVGASIVWADPTHDIVGVYAEVCMNMTEDFEPLWNFDLFQNVATAAVCE